MEQEAPARRGSATGSSAWRRLFFLCGREPILDRLADCGSPAVAGTILVGVELSAAMTGGGCVELGTPE
jgi:hypothetical protein